MRRLAFSLAMATAVVLLSAPALAHKIKVFAYTEGDAARGSVYFPGGGKGKNLAVQVTNAKGEKIGETTTDAQGEFSFKLPTEDTYTFAAETPDGHRGECTVAYGNEAGAGALTITSEAETAKDDTDEPAAVKLAPRIPDDNEDVSLTVAIVSEQLRSLRQNINKLEEKRRFSDIIGGIGYIVGIAGIAFFFFGAKKRDQSVK